MSVFQLLVTHVSSPCPTSTILLVCSADANIALEVGIILGGEAIRKPLPTGPAVVFLSSVCLSGHTNPIEGASRVKSQVDVVVFADAHRTATLSSKYHYTNSPSLSRVVVDFLELLCLIFLIVKCLMMTSGPGYIIAGSCEQNEVQNFLRTMLIGTSGVLAY